MSARDEVTLYKCGHSIDPNDTRKRLSVANCRDCKRTRDRLYMREYKGGLKGNANARRTHCPQGHPYDAENTYEMPTGGRQCKTCRRQRVREWAARYPEKVAANNAAYRTADVERHRENARRWQRENPEKANTISRLKKQRKRAAGVITRPEWEALVAWYGGRCLCCGAGDVTLDHVIPVSKGGLNVIANAQPLCGPCNSTKGTKTIDFRMTAA